MEIQDIFNTQLNKINEDLLFENIWFALPAGIMSDNHLNVTLSNIGILGLNVTTIRVTNVTSGNTTYFDYDYTDLGIIKSGSISQNVTYPSTLLSSYLQVPEPDGPMPVFYSHGRDVKVTFFAFNAGDEGVWFTSQGTRIVFNGTTGHYTGIVDTVSNGSEQSTLNSNTDSPFIPRDTQADIVFCHPQTIPKASEPLESEKIVVGNYNVFVYLNGYDEDGTVFIRSIDLGSVLVVS